MYVSLKRFVLTLTHLVQPLSASCRQSHFPVPSRDWKPWQMTSVEAAVAEAEVDSPPWWNYSEYRPSAGESMRDVIGNCDDVIKTLVADDRSHG